MSAMDELSNRCQSMDAALAIENGQTQWQARVTVWADEP
jgi:hypothetical protein